MLTIDSMTENSYLTSRLEATNNEFLPLGCKDKVEEGYWRCDDRTHPYMVHWKKDGTETGYWSKKTFFVTIRQRSVMQGWGRSLNIP